MSKALAVFKVGLYNIFALNKFKKYNIFKKIGIIVLIIYVVSMLMFSMGFSSAMIVDTLKKANMMNLLLTMFIGFSSLLVFISTLRTSKNNLYDSNDKDLLLSFPIKIKEIVIAKVLDMYMVSLILSLLINIPTFIVYYINTSITVYSIVLLFFSLFIIPIIPTVFGGLFGYLVARLIPKSNKKNIFEILLSFFMFFIIMYIQMNLNNILNGLVSNGETIGNILKYVSYPTYLLNDALFNNNILSFVYYLVINYVLIYIFILIVNRNYLKIISKSSEHNISKSRKQKKLESYSITRALVYKEAKKIISSPIYLVNTLFGMVIMFVLSCATFFISKEEILKYMGMSDGLSNLHLILALFLFCIGMTNITASSISIEGSKLWILKSLPIAEKDIIYSKILFSILVVVPIAVMSSIVLYFSLNFSFFQLLLLILLSSIYALLIAKFGMIVNLRFPKLDAINDQVVVKQSLSSLITIMIPMIIIFTLFGLFQEIESLRSLSINNIIFVIIAFSLFLNIILDLLLNKWAIKRLKHIS